MCENTCVLNSGSWLLSGFNFLEVVDPPITLSASSDGRSEPPWQVPKVPSLELEGVSNQGDGPPVSWANNNSPCLL